MQYVDPVAIELDGEEHWSLPIHREVNKDIFTILPHNSDRASDRCSSGSSCVGPPDTTEEDVIGAWPDYDVLRRSSKNRKHIAFPYCYECIMKRECLEEYKQLIRRSRAWVVRQHQDEVQSDDLF